MPQKQRLDMRLIELGLFASRQAAQAAIIDGGVLVDGQKQTKPGTAISNESVIELASNWGPSKYVSRGGFKLEKALQEFEINPLERICLDIGASTGGFTDCLLKSGASLVYAIDVGYGQLDWRLRNDPRVIVKERINARELTPKDLYAEDNKSADLAVIDVSFISLTKIFPACLQILAPDAEMVCLIKPQFEAGRELVGKGGVVRSPETHVNVIRNILEAASKLDLKVAGLTFSPLKGPAGNIEFLAHIARNNESQNNVNVDVEQIVKQAHEVLG